MDIPCALCGETIIPERDEITCHACMDKLINAANLNAMCGSYSQVNPRVALRDNPHFMPAERAHRHATGSVNKLWVCSDCTHIMPMITDEGRSVCCDAAIHYDPR